MKDVFRKAAGAVLAILALAVLWGCKKVEDKENDNNTKDDNGNKKNELSVQGRWGDQPIFDQVCCRVAPCGGLSGRLRPIPKEPPI